MTGNNQKSIGVKEIAKRANVSIATVDRVLHNRPGVAPRTKETIERIIKEVNYKPNIIASRLASNKRYTFAVLIPAVSEETDFWQGPLDGVRRAEEMIGELGINIEFFFFDLNNRHSFDDQVALILKNKPDGILLSPSFVQEAASAIQHFKSHRIPYVLIDSSLPESSPLSYIGPHLPSSGIVGAQLVDLLGNKDNILIVNLAKEADDHNYLVEIENGFKSYFADKYPKPSIAKLDISITDHPTITKELDDYFLKNEFPQTIFVTNSRVSAIAQYFEAAQIKAPFLIGFDYVSKNIEYLEKGIIDILICHKSEEQGYRGIMSLYQYFVLHEHIEPTHHMSIDIITKENYKFYRN